MYEYIKGKTVSINDDYVVIENNGVGYRIYTANSTIDMLEIGEEVKLYTHLHVREGIMDLYGFYTLEELNMFLLLLTVSGIGPKAAVSIISAIQPAGIALAVATDDVSMLTRAQGVGKKTAQKIILELKDKINAGQFVSLDEIKQGTVINGNVCDEAVSALMMLGYTHFEATRAVSKVAGDETSLETVIKKALKCIAGS